MKLAEALQARADLNRRLEQLRMRIVNNATVQEGESPAEDPQQLLLEADAVVAELETLITRINLTNAKTTIDGKPLTEWIAHRDSLHLQIGLYRSAVDAGSQLARRAAHTEIKILSAVDVAALQRKADSLSKTLRETDNRIQMTNWSTELL